MFLDALIRTSIQGGAAILVIYLALRAFPSVSPKLRLWLWRLVFLKLAVGLIPAASLTLWVLPAPPAAAARSTEMAIEPPLALESNASVGTQDTSPSIATDWKIPASRLEPLTKNRFEAPDLKQAARRTTPKSNGTPINVWLVLYAAGLVLVGSGTMFRTFKFRSILHGARLVRDPHLLSELWSLARNAGRIESPILMESDEVRCAVVVGCKNPAILLPCEEHKPEDVPLILAHEVAHLLHRDLEWNCFSSVVQVLYFFHPLVWLAARAYRQAQESAADQSAIRLSKASPRRYAEMLVRATIVAPNSLVSAASGMSFAGSTASMQQRLRDMRYFNVRPTWSKLAFAVVLTGTSLAMVPGYSLGQAQKPPTKSPSNIQHAYPSQTKPHPKSRKQKKHVGNSKAGNATYASPKPLGISKEPMVRLWALPTPGHDFTVDKVEARLAFRKLFDLYGKSFSISPDVVGSISLFAHNVTFDQALQNMAKQVNARFKIDDGIYVITGRSLEASGQPMSPRPGEIYGSVSSGRMNLSATSGAHDRMQLKLEKADVREALRKVCEMAHVSYAIDPLVQGEVTLDLKNVTFESSLQNILHQVDATYLVENGVYIIGKRINQRIGVPGSPDRRPFDPTLPPGFQRGTTASGSREQLQLDANQADVRQILRKVFQNANVSYSIAPEVQGIVTISLRNVTLEVALQNILRQVDATYRVESGVFEIIKS